MSKSFIAPLGAAFLLASVLGAAAHEYKIGTIEIGHPWSRATPNAAKVAGGYLTVKNMGSQPDRIVSVTSDVSDKVELHEMAVNDGVMTMRALPRGIDVPAGGEVKLAPGGFHVMFLDIKRGLKPGDKVNGTITFEKAGKVDVRFAVEAMGSPKPTEGSPAHANH